MAFYYCPENRDKYVYSSNLSDSFIGIDKDEFNKDEYELLQLFEQLQVEFCKKWSGSLDKRHHIFRKFG